VRESGSEGERKGERKRGREKGKEKKGALISFWDLLTVCEGDSLLLLPAAVFGGGVPEAGIREGNSRIPRERRLPSGLPPVSCSIRCLSLAYVFRCACRPSLSQSLVLPVSELCLQSVFLDAPAHLCVHSNTSVKLVESQSHTRFANLQEVTQELFETYLLPSMRRGGYDGSYTNKLGISRCDIHPEKEYTRIHTNTPSLASAGAIFTIRRVEMNEILMLDSDAGSFQHWVRDLLEGVPLHCGRDESHRPRKR
jgi:hypothetical protein